MQVSVIIPVYNAAQYLQRSVESALLQPETGEVILIDDASKDNSLEVCFELARRSEKVKVFQHPDKANHGAAATRNIGLRNAQFDYIAFLDADDYFLENRFAKAIEVFQSDSSIDGVYEPVGTYYVDEEAMTRFSKKKRLKEEQVKAYITAVKVDVAPDELMNVLLEGNKGHFCTGGIVFKRKLLKKTGLYNEQLRVAEDSLFYLKLAYYGKLVSGGKTEPVAIRVVHDSNTMLQNDFENMYLTSKPNFLKSLFDWALTEKINGKPFRTIFKNYSMFYKGSYKKDRNKLLKMMVLLKNATSIISKEPQVLSRLF
ncbi:glycosyltransferase family 2 protein [Rufibacter quisquiliarum]|uniref:Glycosyltransferase involved in cell wall biosynthesis n=1 Tax=Rufibacter quisquiliarum TaxID=1549639 RepID=A0A839GT58_9BACT|nr:glycosyltransferase family 2 protein [Rufibacter quisquiliarum]MBA9076981.1 glycosyltransferase involved in cell wall biosynthesis [Rufibacter quisquiliarum]